MTISLSDVLGANNASQPFTPAKRDSPWGTRGNRSAQAPAPIRLPEGSMLPSDPEIRAGLTETAEKYKINPALLMALAHQESAYNPDAIGPSTKWGHARGMFQFLDGTAKGHGIDPMDWRQAADAAARDLAQQIATKGLDWAVAHHHGGSNPKQHGPKTAQYTREVLAKAQAIARELGIPFDIPEGQMPDAPKKAGGISLSEVLSAQADKPDFSNVQSGSSSLPAGEESILDTARRRARDLVQDTGSLDVVTGLVKQGFERTIERGWEGLQNFLNRTTEEVTLSDDELRREWQKVKGTRAVTEYGLTYEQWAERNRTRTVTTTPFHQEEQEWIERLKTNPEDAYMLPKRLAHLRPVADDSRFAPANTLKGFTQRIIANHKNPIELFLQDSIPANVVTALFTLPEVERKKFDQLRAVTKALEVSTNPSQYSEEEQAQAEEILAADAANRDPSITRIWKELWQATKEDPSTLGLGVFEALAADPYLLAAPAGVGIQPIRAARVASGLRSTTIAGRASKIADRILDGSMTAAGINVTAGAVANIAESGEINTAEAKLNAAMGAVFGGTLAPIFMRSARARSKSLDAHRIEGTLEEALRDMAKADLEAEVQVDRLHQTPEEFELIENAMRREEWRKQQRFAELLGIRTKKDAEAWKAQRRREIKEWFADNPEYADYQAYLAEERIARAAEEAKQVEARQRRAAEAAYGVSPEDLAAKRQRWQEEFDAAIEARNAARESDLVEAARAEDAARTAAAKLNAEELFYAQLSEDAPTIKQVEAKIRRRNDQLGRHKKKARELGQADPETLARLGVVAGGATAGFTLFPEDEKLAGSLLGGLAGLIAPAGGSVLSRLRQAGAISSDGQIIAALVKAGKMANKLDEAEIKARDNAWVDATRAGDQQAFKAIYDAYMPTLTRYAKTFTENRESRLGIDAEDVAQMAMADFYNFITKNPDVTLDRPVIAWLRRAAKNRAVDVIRSHEGATRKADVVNESQYYKEDLYEGDRGSGRSILDDSIDINAIQERPASPEDIQARDELFDIIRQALDSMPEKHQQLFAMTKLDNYSIRDAAQQLGLTEANALQISKRVQDRVALAIKENRRRLGEEPSIADLQRARGQRGAASPETLVKTAAITALAGTAGTAGYFMYDGDLWRTSLLTAGVTGAAAIATKGDIGKILRGLDYRLRDYGPRFYGLAKKHGYQELKRIREYNNDTADFVSIFRNVPKDIQPILVKALSTRNKTLINKMLREVGGEEFVKAFDKVRKRLDIVEDELVSLGLIKKTEVDYYPFRVKDLEGLKDAITKMFGKEYRNEIESALAAAEKKKGEPLTELEQDIVLNKVLQPLIGKPTGSHMPGFAKARTIQVIPEELQPFYHDPIEALNSYGVQSAKYIEKARFFGQHLKKRKVGNQQLVDTSESVGSMLRAYREAGELTDQQAFELGALLRDRFEGGEKVPHRYIQKMKNIVNGALLGNIASAATQLGDIPLQMGLQGGRASLKSLYKQISRNKYLDLSDLGLNEHIAHEFLSDDATRRFADWSFKWGGFRAIDATGKNFGLNAAISRMMRLAQTEQGVLKLADEFQRYFPDDFPKAITALKKGQVNEAVELMAFAELTRTQPLTGWELPQWYHANPNGRVLYHLQTFSLRVMNLVYEDSLRKLVSGNAKQFRQGVTNLVKLGAALGIGGVVSDKIKDMMYGRPIELGPEEIPVNALEALGISMYDYRQMDDRSPVAAVVDSKLPPIVSMTEDVWKEPGKAISYIPVGGRVIYNRLRQQEWYQRRVRERKKKYGYKMEITVPPSSEGGSRGSRGGRGSRGSR